MVHSNSMLALFPMLKSACSELAWFLPMAVNQAGPNESFGPDEIPELKHTGPSVHRTCASPAHMALCWWGLDEPATGGSFVCSCQRSYFISPRAFIAVDYINLIMLLHYISRMGEHVCSLCQSSYLSDTRAGEICERGITSKRSVNLCTPNTFQPGCDTDSSD